MATLPFHSSHRRTEREKSRSALVRARQYLVQARRKKSDKFASLSKLFYIRLKEIFFHFLNNNKLGGLPGNHGGKVPPGTHLHALMRNDCFPEYVNFR